MNDIIIIIIGLAIISFTVWQAISSIKDIAENYRLSVHERNKTIIVGSIFVLIGSALVCGSVIFIIFSKLFT